MTASTTAHAPPAACSAAVHDPVLASVSASNQPPPASEVVRTPSM
jgi:hypothetical protein